MSSTPTPAKKPARTAARNTPSLRFRIRVTRGDEVAIGPGKIALLEAIRDHGSITEAAKHIDMSYRRAWLLLEEINRLLRNPATRSAQGGKRGGGSVLTPEGLAMIELYRDIERRAEAHCAEQIGQLLKMVGKG